MRLARAVIVAVVVALGVTGVGVSGMGVAAQAAPRDPVTTVTVYHQPLAPTSVTGSGLGAVRTYFIPIAVNGVARDGQYMTGTLTTTALGLPGDQEARSTNLVFVLGRTEDQLVVGGSSLYPTGAGTLAVGIRVIRPVIGGAGKYAGATGQVVSTNLGPDGWTHVFRLHVPTP